MEKLYTVKEIAELLKVSKPTVQRAINAAAFEADKEDNKHSRFYSYEKAVQIIAAINADFDISLLAHQTETTETFGETPQQTPPNEAKQTATPPQTSEFELVKAMLATIQEQLAAKDRQLAAYEEQLAIKDKQIEDYSARLAEAMQLTKGQQFIAAADKVERLTATPSDPEGEEVSVSPDPMQHTSEPAPEIVETEQPPQKKTFWQRIFGK